MSYQEREDSVRLGAPVELYRFEAGGEVWRLTSADETQLYQAEEYTPAPVERESVAQDQDNLGGALRVTVPKSHPVAQLFLAASPAAPLGLTVFRRHRDDPEAETVRFFFRVTSAELGEACVLECKTPMEALRRHIPGPVYQRKCNRILYAPGCDVDPAAFTTTATILEISQAGFRIRAAEFAGQLFPDWFETGWVQKGLRRVMVTKQEGDTLTLLHPLAGLLVNDTVEALAGCQLRYAEDCIAKFDNGPRYLGFPHGLMTRGPHDGVE